jgi:hypothetical protein
MNHMICTVDKTHKERAKQVSLRPNSGKTDCRSTMVEKTRIRQLPYQPRKDVFGSGIAWNGMEPFHSIPFHFIPSHFILAFGWSGKEGTERHGINLKFN